MRLASLRHVGAIMLLTSVLAGCGATKQSRTAVPSKSIAAPTPTPTATASSTADSSAEQQAKGQTLGAYFGLMGIWQVALENPDYRPIDLSQHATDQALTYVTNDIQRSRREGIITKGKLLISPAVTVLDLSANPPVAQVDDCADTTNFLDFRASDGSPMGARGGTPGGLQHFLARVREDRGVWRIYDLHIYTVGSCR